MWIIRVRFVAGYAVKCTVCTGFVKNRTDCYGMSIKAHNFDSIERLWSINDYKLVDWSYLLSNMWYNGDRRNIKVDLIVRVEDVRYVNVWPTSTLHEVVLSLCPVVHVLGDGIGRPVMIWRTPSLPLRRWGRVHLIATAHRTARGAGSGLEKIYWLIIIILKPI